MFRGGIKKNSKSHNDTPVCVYVYGYSLGKLISGEKKLFTKNCFVAISIDVGYWPEIGLPEEEEEAAQVCLCVCDCRYSLCILSPTPK